MIRSRLWWYGLSGLCLLALIVWWIRPADRTDALSPAEMKFREGQQLLEEAKTDSSIRRYREAADLFLQDSLWERWADATIGVAENYRTFGNFDVASRILDSVQNVVVQRWGTENALYAMTVNRQALIRQYYGDYDSSLTMFRQALAIRSRVLPADHPDIAWSLHNIALQHRSLGRYDSAITYFRKAIGTLERTVSRDHPDVAWMATNMGAAFRLAGDYDSAFVYLNWALGVRLKQDRNPASIAHTYNTLGNLLSDRGDYRDALRNFEQALALNSQSLAPTHPHIAAAYYNVGIQHTYLDEYASALAAYAKALDIYQTINQSEKIAQIHDKVGEIHYQQSRYAEAIKEYRKGQALKSNVQTDAYFVGRSYELIGQSQSHMGQHDSAVYNINKSIDIYTQYFGRRHPAVGQALMILTDALVRAGRLDRASESIQRALMSLHRDFSSSKLEDFPGTSKTLNRVKMCFALEKKGDVLADRSGRRADDQELDLAGRSYEEAMAMADEVRFASRSRLSREFFGSRTYRIYEKAFVVFTKLYRNTGSIQYADRAFAAVERARAFQLRQAAFQSRIESLTELPDSLRLLERKLRQQKEQVESRILDEQRGVTADSSKLVYLENQRARLQQEHDDLISRLRDKYPHLFLWRGSDVPTIARVRATIPDSNQSLVEYFEADSSWYVFVISRDSWRLVELGPLQDLVPRVTQLQDAIRQSEFAAYTDHAFAVYQMLVAPWISADVQWRWIVIPDGAVFAVPFDALLTEPAPHYTYTNYAALAYLARQHVISYAPSCTVLLFARSSIPEYGRILSMTPFSNR